MARRSPNQYVALMDLQTLQEISLNSQSAFQKRAEAFFHCYFYQCGVCHNFF